jgi:hypothetical protein
MRDCRSDRSARQEKQQQVSHREGRVSEVYKLLIRHCGPVNRLRNCARQRGTWLRGQGVPRGLCKGDVMPSIAAAYLAVNRRQIEARRLCRRHEGRLRGAAPLRRAAVDHPPRAVGDADEIFVPGRARRNYCCVSAAI